MAGSHGETANQSALLQVWLETSFGKLNIHPLNLNHELSDSEAEDEWSLTLKAVP